MNKSTNDMKTFKLNAMLEYLQDEAERVQTVDDFADLLQVAKAMLTECSPVNAVQGLPNIRAEVMPMGRSGQDVNFATWVPESLVSTFYDLSDRMNQLQVEDPETFDNAANALHWLANNDKCIN